MNRPFYKFHSDAEALYFYFDSVSNRRTIKKIVGYTPMTTLLNGYNLGFGDLYDDGTVDDISVSNNDDMEKVIATVVRTMFHFFDTYPHKFVFVEGSTPERTQLYRIIINKELKEVQDLFEIYGFIGDNIEVFASNRPYDSFLITLKNQNYLRKLLYQNK